MSVAQTLLAGFLAYLDDRREAGLEAFTRDVGRDMIERKLSPHRLAVVDDLRTASSPGPGSEASLVALLADAAASLHWGQSYSRSDFGDAFLAGYGWVELFGTRGHFENDRVAGGFLLLGPGIVYPDHHHLAEEIYIPLTSGSLWSKDGGALIERQAGEIIHHPSNMRHAMRTAERPLVALYLWRGGPLAQKSIISGRDA